MYNSHAIPYVFALINICNATQLPSNPTSRQAAKFFQTTITTFLDNSYNLFFK